MAFNFLENPTGQVDGRVNYPTQWDPATKQVRSDNPAIAGYDLSGRLKTPLAASNIGTFNVPKTNLPALFNGIQTGGVPKTSAGASPTYPLNIPPVGAVSTITATRSGNVSDATASMFNDLNALKHNVSSTLDEFNKQYPDWLKDQKATSEREAKSTNAIYNGEQQNQINALLANYELKANAANAKSIADTQRFRSRANLATGGTGSSALDRGQFATIANINAQAAKDSADRALASNQWLTGLQQQMAGTSAARNRLSVGDTILPATVSTQAFEGILRQLSGLSGVEQQNLLTGIVDSLGYVGDTFGGTQAARIQDFARMISESQAQQKNAIDARNANTAAQNANNASAALNFNINNRSASAADSLKDNIYNILQYGIK